jgi:thiamine phosphate synthase YjbQ (UPF0047 family)
VIKTNQTVNERIQNIGKTAARSAEQFETRMGILIYVTHATLPVSIAEIQDAEVDESSQLIRRYLIDLIHLGYLEKDSIWTYKPTEKAKQLFGVQG